MRRFVGVLCAVLFVVPVALTATPVGAAADVTCATWGASISFSPPLPQHGNSAKVTASVTGTESFSGCAGLGITSGTVSFSGSFRQPENCDTAIFSGDALRLVGSDTITWSTGQTSTVGNFFPLAGAVTSGLFAGASIDAGASYGYSPATLCTGPAATATFVQRAPLTVTLPSGTTGCTSGQPCNATRAASATVQAPGLTVKVSGTPGSGIGTVHLTIAPGSLHCPKLPPTTAPVANLTDPGFTPRDRLTVTATLPLASATQAELVCFDSIVPFKSVSSPSVAKPGTAFLLQCPKVANVAPCVVTSKQVGSNVVVTFVVPGADPRFFIVPPPGGRQVWISHAGTGKVGVSYSTRLQTSGGLAPVRWALASGSLPNGCTLNAQTGTISGKPTQKGTYQTVVQAIDSEKPPSKASLPITITIS